MKVLSHSPSGIHRTASVHPSAIIGEDVVIGAHTEIHPYAVIGSGTRLGIHCHVYPFAHVGSPPQIRDDKLGKGTLEVGDYNRFFQSCTVSVGCVTHGGVTRIGNQNLLMAYTHLGHDCVMGNGTTLANHASLAGHVRIEDCATIGGYAGIHQFVHIGQYSFIAANAMVSKDVPPFGMAAGDRAKLIGLNRKGLVRADLSVVEEKEVRRAFRHCFQQHAQNHVIQSEKWAKIFHEFISHSKRGVLKRHKDQGKADPG